LLGHKAGPVKTHYSAADLETLISHADKVRELESLDDALRVRRHAATKKWTKASVLIGNGMQHDWPLTFPWLGESRAAWNRMRGFFE
jgi:hypothetical protein